MPHLGPALTGDETRPETPTLRHVTYAIREHPDVPGCNGCDRLRHSATVEVAGWTCDAMGLFAVRHATRPSDSGRGWKVDHRPSGHFVSIHETKAEAIADAIRHAGATVDGQPVDWSLSRATLRALRPRMRFPEAPTEVR